MINLNISLQFDTKLYPFIFINLKIYFYSSIFDFVLFNHLNMIYFLFQYKMRFVFQSEIFNLYYSLL